jgi:hypothetical protein
MNPRLIGGEMLLWSDLARGTGPAGGIGPVRGAALAPLLAPFLTPAAGRTLVAGPHDPALLTSGSRPTLLLRGVPDAEALADRFPVLCGGPGKLAGADDTGWDTIVALDGLGRLGSVEDPQLSWSETFEQLLAALRPGGTLLLGLENLLGLHRLVAMPPALTDADWTPAADHDETRPAGLASAEARLRAAGLLIKQTYATFPSPTAPAALIDTNLLTDRTHRGYLEALLSDVCTPLDDTLTDPRRLAINAVRHESAAQLAPGWIIIAHREDSPTPDHQVAHRDRAVVYRGRAGTGPAASERLTRADLPSGDTVESLLLAAALRRDLPRIRALLSAWQSSPAAAVPAAEVIVTGDRAHLPLGTPGTPAFALHAFAVTVLSGGFAHPWPSPAGAADLTITLAAMTGTDLDPAEIPPEAPRPSMQDLLADRDRLTRELTEARAKHAFYERTIADRDRALVRARQLNALLSTTKPAQALLAGARVARKTIRRLRS